MNADFIVILVLNQLLNILIMFLGYRIIKPRIQGKPGMPGIQGPKGDRGRDGKSMYQLALENNFEGTLDEFLAYRKQNANNGKHPNDKT